MQPALRAADFRGWGAISCGVAGSCIARCGMGIIRLIGFLVVVIGGFSAVKRTARINLSGGPTSEVYGRKAVVIGAALVVVGLLLIAHG